MKNFEQPDPDIHQHFLVRPADVLIVDDDPNVAAVLEEFLQEEGFAVCTTCDGVRAMTLIERIQPSVVLADVMMPFMDGITLATEVRRRWSKIDVILMSASESAASVHAPFIQKPFDLDAVIDTICNCPSVNYCSSSNRI